AVLLVNPGVALPTAEVFAARRSEFSSSGPVQPWTDLAGLVSALATRGNDLTEPAIALRPVIGEGLDFLRRSEGVRHFAMSGSGPTCFALYETIEIARRAAARVPSSWWHHVGALVG